MVAEWMVADARHCKYQDVVEAVGGVGGGGGGVDRSHKNTATLCSAVIRATLLGLVLQEMQT